MRDIEFVNLSTRQTPREVLEEDFPRLAPIFISGGWGYDKPSACVILNPNRGAKSIFGFDFVGIEYMFAEYRLYEELIVFKPEDQRYAGIEFELSSQHSILIDERRYDVLKFKVNAFRDEDFEHLKAAYEGPCGAQSPKFDHEAHSALHNSLLCSAEREYWFDVTDVWKG